MFYYLFILLAFLAGDLICWMWANRLCRCTRAARLGVAFFAAVQVSYVLAKIVEGVVGLPTWGNLVWHVTGYLWHIILMPICVVTWAVTSILAKLRNWPRVRETVLAAAPAESPQLICRRDLLSAAASAIPAFVCAGLTGAAISRLDEFSISNVALDLPHLPEDLDGLKIVHLSDLHIGQFFPIGMERKVADSVNALDADLVLLTGDLLDASAREFAPGVRFLKMLNPRQGMVMIEGNHDAMVRNGAVEFEETLKSAGMPLLVNESKSVQLAGRKTPLQFLGEAWGRLMTGREIGLWGKDAQKTFRVRDNAAVDENALRLDAQRHPNAFQILLAHHPHSFDFARSAGIPLTLAGHTHGGQLMLTRNIGVGPMRFRYWSGIYRNGPSRLFVNRGIGGWFPLRVNAPAEIALLTLKRTSNHS